MRRINITLSLGFANMREMIRNYKNSAKRRGLKWDLTEEQIKKITQKNCYYCGIKPSGVYKTKNCNGDYIYNGLDRVNNTKGYTLDNVVPCCKFCNYVKSNSTFQEFQNWIKRIHKKLEKPKMYNKRLPICKDTSNIWEYVNAIICSQK